MEKKSYLRMTLIVLLGVLSGLHSFSAVAPLLSSSEVPIWYRIQLPSWSDGANRAQRFMVNNGTNLFSILPSEMKNSDANLWRLEGSTLGQAKIVSRDGNYIFAESANSNTPVKVTQSVAKATSWSIYPNSTIPNSYYFGMASNTTMRMNAGGEAPGSFLFAWGIGLYDKDDNASAWTFTRVYETTLSVTCNSDHGSVYIGSTQGVTAAQIPSEMATVLHASPSEGYFFKEWQQDGASVSKLADYPITIPTLTEQGTTPIYTAIFEQESADRTPMPSFVTTTTWFKVGSNVNIEVNCTNTSAKIYYTLDGSEPTSESAEAVEKKINLDSSTPKTYTVKIAAQAENLSLSRIATASFRIVSSNTPAALLPIPNERQMFYLHNPHAAFIHYGMNTYTNKEWGTGYESPSSFDPPKVVNTDQWVQVLKECGFDRVVLTGKHHDGFCLWPSKANPTKPHTIEQSPYLKGKGDLFESLSLSCTKYGLDMGVYLSPWDAYEEHVGGHYTSEKYNDFYNTQLDEVLGNYGRYNEKLGRRELVEIWLDGAAGTSNPPVYDFNRFVSTMRNHQPSAFIWIDALAAYKENIDGDSCRIDGSWALNEEGHAPDPCWNKLTPGTNTANSKNKENGKYFHLLEADVSMRSGWFYGDGGGMKSAKDLFIDRYLRSIGRGIPLILNIPPNKDGVFADKYVETLKKYKEYLDVSFEKNLIPTTATVTASQVRADDETFAPSMVLDNDYDSYWTMNDDQKTGSITVDFGKKVRFDMVQFQEYIPLGQRIKNFTIEYYADEQWHSFGSGTTVGYKRIVKTNEVEASSIRINITASLAVPLINSIAVYRSHPDLVETNLPPAIGEDGQFRMVADFMAADETDDHVEVKIQLLQGSDKTVSVYAATLPGSGVQGKVYEDKTETITFEPGVTEKSFIVKLINNTNNEGYKDFIVEISSPTEEATIGKENRTKVLVFDDEQVRTERTFRISSDNQEKGTVRFFYPNSTDGETVTTSSPLVALAEPKQGYVFGGWYDVENGSLVSSDPYYINVTTTDLTLQARFDESYPIMTRGFSNNINQQNRYLRSVKTAGTHTPIVFDATRQDELPFTAFPAQSLGSFIQEGALINKRQTPIIVDKGKTTFTMVFIGYTTAINGYSSELNWTQQAFFIDWNNDGAFNASGEISTKSSNTIGNDNGISASFISPLGYIRSIPIPANQPEGTYRMRVVYYEPQNTNDNWQNKLFTDLKCQIRNGISYDFEIKIKEVDTQVENTSKNDSFVKAVKGAVECYSNSPQILSIYDLSGVLIDKHDVNGKLTFSLKQGFYLVIMGDIAQKIQVQ